MATENVINVLIFKTVAADVLLEEFLHKPQARPEDTAKIAGSHKI